MGFLQAREAERRYNTPRAYQQSAKAAAQRACIGREPGAMFECVSEHAEASQEQANTEQDLSAQQRAATSALVSAMLAFATLVVTGIGVWFVKRTLDATLEAVRDTGDATKAMIYQNELTVAERRPWINLRLEISRIEYIGGNMHVYANVFIKNIGKSIANVQFGSVVQHWKIDPKIIEQRKSQIHRWIKYPIMPGQEVCSHLSPEVFSSGIDYYLPMITLICAYEWEGFDTPSSTQVSYQVARRNGKIREAFADNQEVEAADLWVDNLFQLSIAT